MTIASATGSSLPAYNTLPVRITIGASVGVAVGGINVGVAVGGIGVGVGGIGVAVGGAGVGVGSGVGAAPHPLKANTINVRQTSVNIFSNVL